MTKKQTKPKSARVGRSIRVKTVLQSTVIDSPVEQGATPAISCEGLSHATIVLGTPGNSCDAEVLRDDPQ